MNAAVAEEEEERNAEERGETRWVAVFRWMVFELRNLQFLRYAFGVCTGFALDLHLAQQMAVGERARCFL